MMTQGTKNYTVVLDADALWFLQEKNNSDSDEIASWAAEMSTKGHTLILTPNLIEFSRLWQAGPNKGEPLPSPEDEFAFS